MLLSWAFRDTWVTCEFIYMADIVTADHLDYMHDGSDYWLISNEAWVSRLAA